MSFLHRVSCAARGARTRRTMPGGSRHRGTTFTEVIVASGLLLVALVPILKSLVTAQATGRILEWRTQSLALAQGKLDEIRTRCLYHFDESFDEDPTPLVGSYLCAVEDSPAEGLRLVSVSVGFDRNGDGNLSSQEIEVTLTTYIAEREPGE